MHSANNQGYKLSKQKLNLCCCYTWIPRDLRGIAGEHRLIACCVAASLKLQKTFVSKWIGFMSGKKQANIELFWRQQQQQNPSNF